MPDPAPQPASQLPGAQPAPLPPVPQAPSPPIGTDAAAAYYGYRSGIQTKAYGDAVMQQYQMAQAQAAQQQAQGGKPGAQEAPGAAQTPGGATTAPPGATVAPAAPESPPAGEGGEAAGAPRKPGFFDRVAAMMQRGADAASQTTTGRIVQGALPPVGGFIKNPLVQDVLQGWRETPRALARAPIELASNALQTLDDFAGWATSAPPDEDNKNIRTAAQKLENTLALGEPESATGKLVQDTAQFVLALAGSGGLGDVGEAKTFLGAGKQTLHMFGAFAAGFDPYEERLSNLIARHTDLAKPVTDWMKADPNDPDALARFKNGVESMGLGWIAEGFVRAVRALRVMHDAYVASEAAAPRRASMSEGAFEAIGTPGFEGAHELVNVSAAEGGGVDWTRAFQEEEAEQRAAEAASEVKAKAKEEEEKEPPDAMVNVIRTLKGDYKLVIGEFDQATAKLIRQVPLSAIRAAFHRYTGNEDLGEAGRDKLQDFTQEYAKKIDTPEGGEGQLAGVAGREARDEAPGTIGNQNANSGSGDPGLLVPAQDLADELRAKGGFSYQPVTQDSPKPGDEKYMVSIFPDRGKVLEAQEATPSALKQFVRENRDLFQNPDHYFGAWRNPEDGKVYLDISVARPTMDEAAQLGRQHNQLAIWSFKDMKQIDLPKEGGTGGTAGIGQAGTEGAAGADLRQGGADAGGAHQDVGGPPGPPGNGSGDRGVSGGGEGAGGGLTPEQLLAAARGEGPPEQIESSAAGRAMRPPLPFINFARIDSTEDVQRAMNELAIASEKSDDTAFAGARTFEQMKLDAAHTDAWKALLARREGAPLGDAAALAARALWAHATDKLVEVAQLAVDQPTPENLFQFKKMQEVHNWIQNSVLSARAAAAREVASYRIPVGPSDYQAQAIQDAIRQIGGGADNVRLTAQAVADLAAKGKITELNTFMQRSVYVRTRDALIQALSDGWLSSPVSQFAVLASNVSTGLISVVERYIGENVSKLLGSPNGIAPGEAAAKFSGWVGGFKDAMALAGKQIGERKITLGQGIGEPHEMYPSNISSAALNLSDYPWLGRAADYIGNILAVGRIGIAFQHDMALTMAYRGELNALAYRQAYQELGANELGSEKFKERVAELIANPPDELAQRARDKGKYQAFLDEPGRIAQWMVDGRREIPALRVIAPFIKIPARLMSYQFERTPLAPLMSEFRQKINAGGAERDLALAQLAMGNLLLMTGADLTLSGQLKGSGPPQKGLEQAQEREGEKRDSVHIGNTWYNISRIDPVGKLILMAADVAEAVTGGQQELKDDADTEKVLVGTTFAIARTLTDSSYFTGLANFFATMHDARVGGANENPAMSWLGGLVPQGLARVAMARDPYQREVYSMLDELKSRIPGLSQTLPPRRDRWGYPISNGAGFMEKLISPVQSAPEQHQPIDDEILRQGYNFTTPGRIQSFGPKGAEVKVDMAHYPEAYSRFLELQGHALKSPAFGVGQRDLLNSIVDGSHPFSQIYNALSGGPGGGKEAFLRSIGADYQDAARAQVMREFPDLAGEVNAGVRRQQQMRMRVVQ